MIMYRKKTEQTTTINLSKDEEELWLWHLHLQDQEEYYQMQSLLESNLTTNNKPNMGVIQP